MPTPVSVARQFLTPEAAHALDEAVAVARRRGHAQTTSLHAVSALLSLPTSMLRDACARARNMAYSSRLQFKALELCLSVSLERVQSSQLNDDDPPVSNSLMAAIKRSQANQRRHPENFHLYHLQVSQQCSSSGSSASMSSVKVELQHLVLSILDDPVVSRVFGEAGFRSSEIKLAIVRPIPRLFGYSHSRGPPLFLGSFGEDSYPGCRAGFPFLFGDGNENCGRIGEILRRNNGRNPLLVGVCAYGALKGFIDDVEKKKENVLPLELSGLDVVSIESDVRKFVAENCDRRLIALRFEEVGFMVERCFGPGVVVNYGDLKVFVNDNASSDSVSYVVAQLSKLLAIYRGKVWLMGAAVSNEAYLKFASRFQSVEKDWDLQLLPITSRSRPSEPESYPKSSLMESFVPFGGLFSAPSDLRGPLIGSYQTTAQCHLCNEKYEQEVNTLRKGGHTASVADHCCSSLLPQWQMNELDVQIGDVGVALTSKVSGLQKKSDIICQHVHHRNPYPDSNLFNLNSKLETIMGFHVDHSRKENADKYSISINGDSSNEANCCNVTSLKPMDLQRLSTSQSGNSVPLFSKPENLLSKLCCNPKNSEDLVSRSLKSPPCSLSNSIIADVGRTSPTSVTSVTTDLGMGISSTSTTLLETSNQESADYRQESPDFFSANVSTRLVSRTNFESAVAPSACVSIRQSYPKDFKMIHGALVKSIYWQQEAINVISNTIANRQTKKKRGDIWFNFIGPDRLCKKKTAITLAEIIYGSRENLIYVDFGSQEGSIDVNAGLSYDNIIRQDLKFRGKTVVDYVAEELHRKPFSVVFLENVDRADIISQSMLCQAVLTGKLSDSHGREIGINNSIFVLSSTPKKGVNSSPKEISRYSEEGIFRTKYLPIRILIECSLDDEVVSHCSEVSVTSENGKPDPIFLCKRKLSISSDPIQQHGSSEIVKRAHKTSGKYLDLNLPAQVNELQDIIDQVDETVFFKPFDFEELANKVSKKIYDNLCKIIGSRCSLEIDVKVMEQLLAVSYISERDGVVEDWIEHVLSREFAEVHKRDNLTSKSIVKLVTCEILAFEEQSFGVCLPPRIMVNQ